MSGTPISRQTSLESNLFGSPSSSSDPDAAREIAALAAELQQNTSNPSKGPPQMGSPQISQLFTVPSLGQRAQINRPTGGLMKGFTFTS